MAQQPVDVKDLFWYLLQPLKKMLSTQFHYIHSGFPYFSAK